MNKYTIIATQLYYGQLIEQVESERVKFECERLKKLFSLGKDEKCYHQIEVVNNETGEIREYWNNHDNKIQF